MNPRTRRIIVTGVLVALVLIAVLGAILPAWAEDVVPPEGSTPVVGMAYGSGSSTLWLAGPGADDGVVVSAEDGREVSFGGDPESVQALAWRGDRLWVGDIGDADASRDFVVVFRLGELEESRLTYFAYDFVYEDGPRDAQAMMISGRGRIYIATAGADPGIYRAELEPSRQEMNTLTRVADAPEGVTDGVFLSDGTTLALRTDVGIEYIDALTWEPLATDTIIGAPEGESVAVGPDDQIFVGGNPLIREVEVPSSDVTTTVAPSAEPSASASPEEPADVSPSASPSAEPEDPGPESAPARTGTTIALVLAGLVALIAGAVTFLVRT
ncbi:MAG TPA: hypothetical protein VLQ67_08550 [Arachnia sp.]|nr:hypothetical protein [Arachnia sp.]